MSDPFLEQRLIEHEGIKKSAYNDSRGYLTIGIGFLIDPKMNAGLSIEECMMILRSRILNLERQLSQYPWFNIQDQVRKGVLIEMAYNLGVNGLLGFKNMIAALGDRQVGTAAVEMGKSLWATQIGQARLKDMQGRMREGSYKGK
jgi:lysozyme